MFIKKLLIAFSTILFALPIFAQEKDSILSVVLNEFGQEKAFIHFDKSIYNKGETIWFKAYLQNGDLPSTQSKNFYADWYNDSGALIKHDVFPILQSSASGQFIIADDYKGKSLHIKAYTTWMLNFDTSFLYNKNITIFQASNKPALVKNLKSSLQFFPEGGDIINGIGSFVAFKATDQFLKPISIKGIIKNDANEIIDSIKTEHDGMGMVFLPNPNFKNTYTAFWQDDITNTLKNTTLPKVLDEGVAMQVQNINNKILVNVSRSNNVSDDKKMLHIFCFMNNNTLYQARVKLLNKTTHSIEIPTTNFGTGIVQVTVFNDNYVPLAERVVFVNNEDYQYYPTITTPLKNITKRGKNVVEINVTDSAFCNMSIAITDANTLVDSTSNIISHLLLSADIKGFVNNSAYYFANNNDSTQQHLDLVMLTNGWRKYNWQKIFSNKLPYIKYQKDTSYLNIIGNTFGNLGSIKSDQQIIMFAETFDSLRKQFILPVNKKGVFGKSNFIFYDRLKLSYSFLGNKNLNNDAEVVFQNGLFNRQPLTNFDTLINNASQIDYAFYEKMKKLDEDYNRLRKIKNAGILDDVMVENKKKNPKDVLDQKYTSSMFTGGDAYQFDVMNDLRGQSSLDVFHYLSGTVAGLQINTNGGEVTAKWRGAETSFFLDEMQSDAERIGSLSMTEIAYIKVFKPPFFGSSGGGSGGAIAIYTRKGADVQSTPGKGLTSKYLMGYSNIKQFYSPNYEKETSTNDVRTTLYWNPYIITNNTSHKATITFFNNDISKKLKIVLCGTNTLGKIAWVEKFIE